MVDLHTHVLPGIDDGSKSVEMSESMIKILKEQGVSTIFCTPHYYPTDISLSEFIKNRNMAYDKIKFLEQDVKLILGSETYISEILFNHDSLTSLCIGNSDYLLLELPYERKWSKELFKNVERIISKYDVIPIIAHVERYMPIQSKHKLINEFIDMDCLIQMNTASIVDEHTRKFALKLIKKGYINFLGTDSHNLTTRKPLMSEAINIINEKLGNDYIEEFAENTNIFSNIKNII